MLGLRPPSRGRYYPWFLLALALLRPIGGAWSKGLHLPCPPKGYDVSEISPCKCRLTIEDYLQVWCSGSDLGALTKGLAALALWRGSSPVDELVVEGGIITGLPGRAFSPLTVRRLLMHRSGLERVSSAALLGLEGSLVELMLVEPRLRSLPADLLDMLPHLEALTIDVTDTQDGSTAEGDAFPGRPLSVPLLGSLPSLRYLRVSAPTTSGLSGMFPPRDPQASFTLPALLSLSVHGGWAGPRPGATSDDALWSALSFFAGCCGGVEELLLDGNGLRLGKERVRVDAMLAPRGGDVSLRSLKVLDISDNPLGRPSDSFASPEGGSATSAEVPPQTQWLLDGAPSWVLPALSELRADRSSLSVLPEGAVQSLQRLERLSLEGNAMRSIGPDALYDLPSLLELRLRDNFLSEDSMPPPPYRRRLPWTLPALKGLDLSKNMLRGGTSLRRLLSGTPSIRRLDLSDNAISSLADDSFAASPLLEFVDLSGNPVLAPAPGGRPPHSLLSFLKPLSRLYELRISGAPPTPYSSSAELPLEPRVGRLRHHQAAPGGGGTNSFPALPPLPGVEVLVASGMGIRRLYRSASRHPPPFSNALLPRLTSLDLSGNDLTVLDTGAFAGVSPTLSAVDLSRNRLVGVLRLGPPLPMNSLRKLDVSENQLEAISVVSSANNPELKVLNASGNVISSLEMALPAVLGPSLEVLDLSRNSVASLPEEPLKPFVSLTELWLDGNGICSISGRPFDAIPRLRVLSLRHNRLATLSPTPFRRFLSSAVVTPYSSASAAAAGGIGSSTSSNQRSHALLNLEGNPLSCSCRLLWLQEWLQEMEDEVGDEEDGMKQGIKCKDGTPLHQKRLSRKDCQRQLSTSALISSRGDSSLADELESRDDETSCRSEEGSKAHASPPQELLARPLSSSSLQQQQPPSPEESEYFYDQYVDEIHPAGPLGNGGNNIGDDSRNGHLSSASSTTTSTTTEPTTTTITSATEASNDYVPGDTPTIYAGTRPKNASSTDNKDANNGNGGISIFGIPIPSWSSLFGSGKKRTGGTAKVARVNGPPRAQTTGQARRRGNPKVMADRNSISYPKLESGFRPIFPGSGGFVPIVGKLDTSDDTNATQDKEQWPASVSNKPVIISHLSTALFPSNNASSVASPSTETSRPSVTTFHGRKTRPSFAPNTMKPFETAPSTEGVTKSDTQQQPSRNGHVRDKYPTATEPTGMTTGPFPSSVDGLGRFPTKWTGTRAVGTVERVELKKNVGIELGAVGSVAGGNRGLKGSVGKAIMVIDDSDSDGESGKTEGVRTGAGVHGLPEIITVRGGLLENVDRTNVTVTSTTSIHASTVLPPTSPWDNPPSVVLQTTAHTTQSLGNNHVTLQSLNKSTDVVTEEFSSPTTWLTTEKPREAGRNSVQPRFNTTTNESYSTTDLPHRETKAPTSTSGSQGTLLSSYLLAPGGQAKVTKISKISQHHQQYEGDYYPHASQASVDVEFHDIELHKQDRTKSGIGYTKWPSEENSKRSRLPEWYYANYNATEKEVYRGPLEDIIVTEGYPGFPSSSPGLRSNFESINKTIFVAIILTVFLKPVR